MPCDQGYSLMLHLVLPITGEYILDSFTEYLHKVPITPLTLSKKHAHKNVKAHYIAYK